MASMNMEEQLDKKQPKVEKPINGNCQEPLENANTNGANLTKSEEKMDKESTNLPFSRPHHRKLAAELNREIFYCLNVATRRKFILGLGWDFYAMFRQILLMKSKRLRNPPEGNGWRRSNAEITISNGGLDASKNTNGFQFQNVYAEKGFPISGQHSREDNFPGTILYYYEVKLLNSARWCDVGLTDGEIYPYGWIGQSPNSYAIGIPNPNGNVNFYNIFRCAGQRHLFEFPEGLFGPQLKETLNVYGCGLLMNPDDKLTIFYTVNGILIDRQIPIDPTVDHLFPTVTLWDQMSLEANFGDNPAKPFEYDIKKCPGMGLDWI